jgi:multidrug efflux pump
MNIFAPMIRRPAGTSLLALGLILAGICAYFLLGVAALPSFELPVVFVQAAQPGASAQTMASTVLAPLERHLGQIPGIDEMYGNATEGSATVVVRFHFGRDTDKAARDVQAAINAAQADLPVLPSPPQYFKADTASIPILLVTLKSMGCRSTRSTTLPIRCCSLRWRKFRAWRRCRCSAARRMRCASIWTCMRSLPRG